jgi:hypothetical protein
VKLSSIANVIDSEYDGKRVLEVGLASEGPSLFSEEGL